MGRPGRASTRVMTWQDVNACCADSHRRRKRRAPLRVRMRAGVEIRDLLRGSTPILSVPDAEQLQLFDTTVAIYWFVLIRLSALPRRAVV